MVGDGVGVLVGVRVGVKVGVRVGVWVEVLVGVGDGVLVGVKVGVKVRVGVGVGVGDEHKIVAVTALEVTALAPKDWMKAVLVMPLSPTQETGPHQVTPPFKL